MSEISKKGPLIQKRQKTNTLERPKPVLVNNQNDFKFSNEEPQIKQPVSTKPFKQDDIAPVPLPETKVSFKELEKKQNKSLKKKSVVGKNNNVKSIKVPHELHVQIGVLGKFMDENKTYAIISELVKYYAENELTDRQQKQFGYMTDFFNEQED